MTCEEFTNAFGESAKIPDEKNMYSGNLAIFVRYIIIVLVDRFIYGVYCIRLQRKFCMDVGKDCEAIVGTTHQKGYSSCPTLALTVLEGCQGNHVTDHAHRNRWQRLCARMSNCHGDDARAHMPRNSLLRSFAK